jgi:hypothetical protein
VPPPSSLNSDVPEALDRLILDALARGDGQGFGSMAELLRALDSLLAPDATSAPTPEAEDPPVSSANGTSAFDVPPVELPPAPVVPLAAAPSRRRPALTFLFGWQPARMAAGVALVGLGVALSLLARRTHVSRPAGRTPPRAAVTLPPPAPPAPPVQTALPGATPAVPLEAPPPTDLAVPEKACRISIGSKPWAQVWIDGKNTGRHTPILNYKIACGERTLTLRNAELALAKSVVVTLKPHLRLRKVVRLTDPDPAATPSRR